MTEPIQTTIGDFVARSHRKFMDLYGDEELAAIATSAALNRVLLGRARRSPAKTRPPKEGSGEKAPSGSR